MGRRRRTKVQRIINLIRRFIAFLFSHVGLCALVVGYAMLGAVVFQAIELPHEIGIQNNVKDARQRALKEMWLIAFKINLLDRDAFSGTLLNESFNFRASLMAAVKEGYDGKDTAANPQWTMSGAFLYSLTVITTIGYGHIAPRTYFGKAITIIYAIVGVPLLLLFLTNVGDILAKTFRFIYAKISNLTPSSNCCRNGAIKRQSSFASSRHSTRKSSLQSSQHSKHTANKNSGSHVGGTNPGDTLSIRGSGSGANRPMQPDPSIDSFEGAGAEIITMDDIRMETYAERYGASVEEQVPSLKGSYKEASDAKYDQMTVPIGVILFVMALYLVSGAALFCFWEKDWKFLDGIYFCYISLTTIGFGDLMPGNSIKGDNSQTQEKLVICSLYLLFGMALIAMCFNLAQEEVVNKVTKIATKLGMIKQEDDEEYD